MPDIFISYKREDRDSAHSLAEYFATHGFDVWWDVDLLPGDEFDNEINAALNRAKAAIVLWTPLAVESSYVRAEASLARERNILIPILLEEAAIPVPFNLIHTLDLTNWESEIEDPALLELLEAVNKLVDEPSLKNTSATNENVDIILQKPEEEIVLWKSIIEKDTPSVSDYQEYIDEYGDSGWFSKIAQKRIDEQQAESSSQELNFTLKPKMALFLLFSVCSLIFLLNIDRFININSKTNNVNNQETTNNTPKLLLSEVTEPDIKGDEHNNDAPGEITRIEDDEESMLWISTNKKNTFESYVNFLKKFPDGQFSKIARLRIEKGEQDYWKEVYAKNRKSLYQEFIEFYPNSKLSSLAKQKVAN